MNNDKKFIGMYHNDSELMAKIDELKAQGIDGENIYVIAQDDSDVVMFQGMKYGDVQTKPESWFDRFMDFLTGENHVRSMLHDVGVADGDMDNYYNEIQNGGKLLYVDEGEVNRLHTAADGSFSAGDGSLTAGDGAFNTGGAYRDPNLGGNRLSEYEENELSNSAYADTSTGAFQDSNLYEGNEASYGRVGGEALHNTNYETPPNNEHTPMNRFNDADRYDDQLTEEKMRLREERLSVDKQEVERGEVSLHKDVVEEEQSFDVPVMREEVYIERRPVNEFEENPNDFKMRQDDETIRVPITEERLEVTKKPYVSEEIVVGKRQVEDTETVNETVKHEEARFEQSGEVDVQDEFIDEPAMRNKKDYDSF